MRFKFGLEALLKYRKSIEDQYRMELATLREKQLLEEEKMFYIRENQRVLQNNLRNKNQNSLLYLEDLSRQSIAQRKILNKLDQEITGKRNMLIDASKSRKIIEKLKERKLDEYNQELKAKENKVIDDLVTNRFSRKDNQI